MIVIIIHFQKKINQFFNLYPKEVKPIWRHGMTKLTNKMIRQLIEMEIYKSDDGRQLYELTKEELGARISKSI